MITFESESIGATIHAHTDGIFLAPLADDDLTPGNLFGLDTESTALTDRGVFDPDYRLRLVQIASETVAHVFDMEDQAQRQWVYEFLADDRNSFCAHTNIDTLAVWVTFGVDISLSTVDTRMLATMAQPDDRDGGNDLKTLSRIHLGSWLTDAQKALGTTEDKFDWDSVSKLDRHYLIYAGLDAIACRRLVPILTKLTTAPATLMKIETWADSKAAQWKMRGYRIDTEKHAELMHVSKTHCDYHAEEFGKLAFNEVLRAPKRNPHYVKVPLSPRSVKVGEWLAKHGADFIGYPLTDTGKEMAEEGTLTYELEASGKYASLSKKHAALLEAMPLDEIGREALTHLLAFKEKAYTLTKMEEIAKVLCPDGRVHNTTRTIGAVTGRWSSSGPNFQNFGKKAVEMREIIIPDPGNVFVAADFDQVELRVVAALAHVKSMIRTILDGEDLHDLTAALAHVTRTLAKIVNFLIVYGGGAKALNEQTGIPVDEGRKVIAAYKEAYPEVVEYAEYCATFEEEIRPVSGRKIPVGKTKDGRSRSYANVNYMVQGSARELAVAAWWRYQHDPERNGDVVMIIHDELIVECPLKYAEEEKKRLERHMSMDFMGVPISAGGAIMADKTGRPCWTSVDAAEAYAKYREERGIEVRAAA